MTVVVGYVQRPESEQALHVAEGTDAQLIVVGVEPKSRVEQLLLGSVAREVLLRAPCPVLTVKAPEHS